jgi:molybdopterin biosynthesis enzyme
VVSKVSHYGSTVTKKIVAPDDGEFISRSLKDLVKAGVNLILVTAGLSVDPDDVTVAGIKKAGATVEVHGSPVMPGSMFLYAHLGSVPVLGLPACVFHHSSTVFDLVFPRVLAGLDITRKDIVRLGHGGLCLNCGECRYPVCPFGKG